MEVKINREIQEYQENIFFGLNLRQLVFSALAIAAAVAIYFGLRNVLGTETVSWLCVVGALPFGAMGFVKYNGMSAEEFIENEKTLFDMRPGIVVLNHDDTNYDKFAEFRGSLQTLDYGQTGKDVRVLSSKLYPKGTEATLSVRSDIMNVATFIPGETAVSYMACATAIAVAMGVSANYIVDGLANYQPEE